MCVTHTTYASGGQSKCIHRSRHVPDIGPAEVNTSPAATPAASMTRIAPVAGSRSTLSTRTPRLVGSRRTTTPSSVAGPAHTEVCGRDDTHARSACEYGWCRNQGGNSHSPSGVFAPAEVFLGFPEIGNPGNSWEFPTLDFLSAFPWESAPVPPRPHGRRRQFAMTLPM